MKILMMMKRRSFDRDRSIARIEGNRKALPAVESATDRDPFMSATEVRERGSVDNIL